jgi:hypothetical protein
VNGHDGCRIGVPGHGTVLQNCGVTATVRGSCNGPAYSGELVESEANAQTKANADEESHHEN